jgi:hypothetical protein
LLTESFDVVQFINDLLQIDCNDTLIMTKWGINEFYKNYVKKEKKEE